MADEKLNIEVILSASSQGVEGVAQKASLVQDAVDALNKVVPLGEKVLNAYAKTTDRLEKSFGGAASGAQKMAGTFGTVRSEVLELDRRLQSAAESALGFGSRNIFGDAVQNARMTGEEARKVADYYEAIGINAKSAAKAINDAAEASARVSRNAQLGNASSARNQVPSRPGGVFAQGQLYDTAKAAKAAETTWAREAKAVQDLDLQYDAHVKSFNNVMDEKSKASQQTAIYNQYLYDQEKATQAATGAIQQQETHLPRLRYALHDVSNQLLVIGGAMTAFSVLTYKSAIDYERAFANVIRTNDSLMNSQVAANRMFREFMDLAGEIPTSFGDLSEIGALAGQLNIPANALRDFTESVAMFSATTGESIDSTATAFGRLDALLPGVQGNFQALGSSILNVGINSVATEGEIIKITTQLAGIGAQAGLTYDELIGLSGALASVGIQPELSRGTITRLFGQISRSVTLGGESLQEFARISGQSADQFASQWASAPMEAVVGVLRGLNARGGEAEAALRAVGITSVRDVPAILRLAQTVDTILVPALGDAADGAEQATQLAENYGVIADTVAARLQILANNAQSLMAVMGDSNGVFAIAIDILNNLLESTRKLMENPITAFFVQGAVAATALSGVVLILLAGVTRAAAGILAFRTAMGEAGVQATGFRAQLMALTGTIAGVDAASLKASGNMSRLANTMRIANIAAVALVAIPLANWIDDWSRSAQGAVVDIEALSTALKSIDADLSEGLSEDIQATLRKSLESIGASFRTGNIWADANPFTSLERASRNSLQNIENEFDLGLDRLRTKASFWATTDLFTGEATWMAGFFDASIGEIEKFEEAWIQAWETASSETQKQAILDTLNQITEGWSTEEIEAFNYHMQDFYDAVGAGVDQTALLAERTEIANQEFEALQETLMAIVDEVFASVNAQADLSGAMADLGGDYINLGAAAAFSGENMQSAMKTIIGQSGSAGAAAANLQVLYDFILANSSATAGELIHLANAIKLLNAQAGGKKSAPTMLANDFQSFAVGANQARAALTRTNSAIRDTGKAAREAREEVRTLVDYASDLRKVWDRAFEIRFSGSQTADAITSTFLSLRDAADQAAKKIRDLNNDIRGLSSDIDIQEYFLSIAIEYGDTKRAEAIEAELLKKRAELADKTAELQKEQDAASKSLVGNTAGAIANRKSIQDLVQQYQDHIGALAASGMSQEQLARATAALREDFIRQATQLGYNRRELEVYARAFDDVTVAVKNVPRNITVKANTNPALQALNEFNAKVKSTMSQARNSVGNGISIPVRGSLDKAAKDALFTQWAAAAQKQYGRALAQSASGWAEVRRLWEEGAYSKYGWASGGYTGPGGKYEPAGIVHRGEYVIPKHMVNQSTGLPYADALGRLMGGLPSRSTASAASSSSPASTLGVVDLSSRSIQAIAQAVPQYIVMDAKLVGESTSQQYARTTSVGGN